MKITANQNLIPYFQPRRDELPANQPDGENHPELNRGTLPHSLLSEEQPYRYYIRKDLENSIYTPNKDIVAQYMKFKGMIVDIYV
ncbi:MAG: hypothetical protein C0403_19010 [Desulfobacterium sp.]|nr:hypothetical protein [Desulfobacterium sp.]